MLLRIWESNYSLKRDISSGIPTSILSTELTLKISRLIYQNTLIETIIFASLAVHLTVNTILISRRWKREKDPKAKKSLTLAQKMHRWSGYVKYIIVSPLISNFHHFSYFLATVIVGHILATRYQQNFFGPEYQADFAFTT